MKYLHYYLSATTFENEYTNNYEEPWTSYVEETDKVKFNKTEYEKLLEPPLTFEITGDGVIRWKAYNTAYTCMIECKKNDGEWTQITSDTGDSAPSISVVSGDVVQFRGNNETYSSGSSRYNYFSGTTAGFNVKGNIMSLINSTNFSGLTALNSAYTFYYLFSGCTGLANADKLVLPATTLAYNCYCSMFQGCTSLTTAPELPATTLESNCYYGMFRGCTGLTTAPELPATTLAYSCYYNMFQGCKSLTTAPELPATTLAYNCYYNMLNNCTSLTTAPELPATTLVDDCYDGMFFGCTSLTTAPELPATTLAYNCYCSMFQGCTSLTTAPELPATTLEHNCYYGMFRGCTGLTTAPELPATTLASYCYYNMFSGCTSLTTAPELPATTLASNCYGNMFFGCTKLAYVKAMFTTTPGTSYTNKWLSGVSATGTFVKNSAATWNVSGVNGVPSGWTVQTASA